MNNLIFLKNFATYSEAELAKNLLENNDIKSMLQKGDIAVAGEFSGYAGDANLFVLEKDHNKAKEILGIKDNRD
ncbi:MAG TPA: hypothetical protein ENH26_00705 [Candidatus Wolfebacteria bacterium]|nr:hypothetical protein [Candidatus Wolfebacteria bacterium]